MPKKYARTSNRAAWSEESLQEAIRMVKEARTTIWQTSIHKCEIIDASCYHSI